VPEYITPSFKPEAIFSREKSVHRVLRLELEQKKRILLLRGVAVAFGAIQTLDIGLLLRVIDLHQARSLISRKLG
jgi:hypothetical protein